MSDLIEQVGAVGNSSRAEEKARPRKVMLGLCALALLLCFFTLWTVAKRVAYPYDFMLWPDDYVLNELLKLHLGAPIYGSYSDANSYIYAPGGALLQRALLAPFGLDLSLVANRVVTQTWLALAIAGGVQLVGRISSGQFGARSDRLLAVVGAAATLTLAGYSNSIVDSLHPTTLELLGLVTAATVAAMWTRLSFAARILACLVLPACSLLAKQTGVSVAIALAAVALTTRVASQRERLLCAFCALSSPVVTFGALLLATDNRFFYWGLLLPLRQPPQSHHAVYLLASVATITPSLVLMTAARKGSPNDPHDPRAAWWRVAWFPSAYVLVAVPAFLKIGGGAFDFGAVTFFGAILALAQLRNAFSGHTRALPLATLGTLCVLQLLLWAPYRRAPRAADYSWGKNVCGHVKDALDCGERVLVDLGTSCLVEAGATEVPRDRLSNLMELTWGGLADRMGTADRLEREEYDMLVVHLWAVPWPWPDRALRALYDHYSLFAAVPSAVSAVEEFDVIDKVRLDDWQGLDYGVLIYERKRDAGRHPATIKGPPRCRRAPSTASGRTPSATP